MTNTFLKKIAGKMAFELGKKSKSNPTSNTWLYAFLTRWRHDIASMKPRALETSHAKNRTPEIIEKYFENLEQILIQNNLCKNLTEFSTLMRLGYNQSTSLLMLLGIPVQRFRP